VGSPFPVQASNRSCPLTLNVPLNSLGVEGAWLPEGDCAEGVSVPESGLAPQPKINNRTVAEATIDAARRTPTPSTKAISRLPGSVSGIMARPER
jgi:hypothetical protein